MLYPSINDLLKKIDNRYTLVVAVSKRARKLIDGDRKMVNIKESKPVSLATYEVSEGKIGYRSITSAELAMIEKQEQEEKEERVEE